MSYGFSNVAAWNMIAKTSAPSSVSKPAPSVPSSPHAGYTLPSAPAAPAGGEIDPRLAAFLDEQEKREKRRKRRLKQEKREAAKIQNQPWFYPTVIGASTLFIILLTAATRRR